MTTSIVNYYREIECRAPDRTIASDEDLGTVLHQINEMDRKYQSYLKTHNCVVRTFLKLCWWNSSVYNSYSSAIHALAGRVAEGYQTKLIDLLANKIFLKKPVHRAFFGQALSQARSNVITNKNIKGYVWKIINPQGVANYLIGTIHYGTENLIHAKGLQEAMQKADSFYTEADYTGISNQFSRFSFCLDSYIVRQAKANGKSHFVLDNAKLRNEKQTNPSPPINSPLPDINQLQLKLELPEVQATQHIRYWQLGDHLDEVIKKAKKDVSIDERTKAWLNQSYENADFEKPLPGLIDQIHNAVKPICIAVGLGHCIGSDVSLVEEFQKTGFNVSRFE